MDYVSTRGEAPVLGFRDVLLAGLARDGGLYVPREWPFFTAQELRDLRGLSYQALAVELLWPFVEGEIERQHFAAIITDASSVSLRPAFS